MEVEHPSLERQRKVMDNMRQRIDINLRAMGFEVFLRRHNIDAALGKIVVGRSFEFSSELADQARRYDPLVEPLVIYHQVGLYQPSALFGSRFFPKHTMLTVSAALMSGLHEPTEWGNALSSKQLVAVHHSIDELLVAQELGSIPNLSEDCLTIDDNPELYL